MAAERPGPGCGHGHFRFSICLVFPSVPSPRRDGFGRAAASLSAPRPPRSRASVGASHVKSGVCASAGRLSAPVFGPSERVRGRVRSCPPGQISLNTYPFQKPSRRRVGGRKNMPPYIGSNRPSGAHEAVVFALNFRIFSKIKNTFGAAVGQSRCGGARWRFIGGSGRGRGRGSCARGASGLELPSRPRPHPGLAFHPGQGRSADFAAMTGLGRNAFLVAHGSSLIAHRSSLRL